MKANLSSVIEGSLRRMPVIEATSMCDQPQVESTGFDYGGRVTVWEEGLQPVQLRQTSTYKCIFA